MIPPAWKTALLLLAPLLALYVGMFASQWLDAGSTRLFAMRFLSLFIEAAPFLLIGSIVSGCIETYARPETVLRFVPKNRILQVLAGSCLGLIFPVCECGVVPVVRRLFRKGMPAAMGVAFLLGAPVLNPIVIFGTYKAFGLGPMLLWRVAGTLGVASIAALFVTNGHAMNLGRKEEDHERTRGVLAALRHAADDFLGIGAYLVVGALLAACAQTFVPPSAFNILGGGNVVSVLAMEAIAFVLSICSTVDAFIALGFASAFTGGSIVSFLVFGPMVDIKSTLMFIGIFPRRTVLRLVLTPFALATVLGVALNFLNVF
jgi:uncharacterized membrane protein YraQ (UPF0718 family)